MPYVLRDAHGHILSVHRTPVPQAEHLPSGHPELQQWLGGVPAEAVPAVPEPTGAMLAHTDAALIRVLEDLVDALVSRHVLSITDLPNEAQQKLFARKHLRDRLQSRALELFGSEPLHFPPVLDFDAKLTATVSPAAPSTTPAGTVKSPRPSKPAKPTTPR